LKFSSIQKKKSLQNNHLREAPTGNSAKNKSGEYISGNLLVCSIGNISNIEIYYIYRYIFFEGPKQFSYGYVCLKVDVESPVNDRRS